MTNYTKYRRLVHVSVSLLAVVVIGSVATFCWYIESRLANYRHIEFLIARLGTVRPDNLSESQWSGCVYWTWQLHTNYGGDHYFDHKASCKFADRFQQQFDGRISLATIDWIWEQYIEHTVGGQRYSDLYRPTTPERLSEADKWDYPPLEEWAATYHRIK